MKMSMTKMTADDLAGIEKSTENRTGSSSSQHPLLKAPFLKVSTEGSYHMRLLPPIAQIVNGVLEMRPVRPDGRGNRSLGMVAEAGWLKRTRKWVWGLGVTFNVQDDPITQYRIKHFAEAKRLKAEGDVAGAKREETLAKHINLSTKHIVPLIDRDDESAGVKLSFFPNDMMKDLRELIRDDRNPSEPMPVNDPMLGRDLRFSATKEKGDRFAKQRGFKFSDVCPLHEDEKQTEAWMQFLVDNPIESLLIRQEESEVEDMLIAEMDAAPSEEEKSEPKGESSEGDDKGSTSDPDELDAALSKGEKQ